MADNLSACDPAMRELYQAELDTHLPVLGEGLLALEKDPNQPKRLDAMMRAAHSIKGAARIVDLEQTVRIAHVLEDCLVAAQKGELVLRPQGIDVLLRGVDLLGQVATGKEMPAHAIEETVRAIAALRSAGAAIPEPAPAVAASSLEVGLLHEFVVEAREHLAHVSDDLLQLEKLSSDERLERIDRLFRAVHSVKGGAKLIGKQQIGSLAHALETAFERLRQGQIAPNVPFVDALLAGHDQLQSLLDDVATSDAANIAPILARLEALQGAQASTREAPLVEAHPFTDGERPSTIRIPVQILDRLMTLAGELVLTRNQALRAVSPDDAPMRQVVQRLHSITAGMQQAVMLTRMQPVTNLFGKFPRLVRDLAKQLGKQIELTLRGTEVELDKSILEVLSDPLNHLVRNACDHGIESPSERIAAGKPLEGQILLQAFHEGGQIRIEIRDDGRGIDPQRVRRKALEKGLRTQPELDALSDADAQALILLPGFSTAEAITDLSGRGVGMDVVRTNVEQLGGSLQIESIAGAGASVHLRLPLTLAIIPCLLVRVGGQRYALPQKDIEELVCLQGPDVAARVEMAHDYPVFRLRDKLLRLVGLGEVLDRPARQTGGDPKRQAAWGESLFSFAVVKAGGGRFGLVVDQLLDTEEVVVKPMHSSLKSLRIFSGCTIMGDGSVALILDVEGIARHAGALVGSERAQPCLTPAARDERQSWLVFRSGPDEQFAVPLALIRRIELLDASAIERLGTREVRVLQGETARIVRLDRYLDVSPLPKRDRYFLLLPKQVRRPMGVLFREIVDTVEAAVELDGTSYKSEGIIGTASLLGRLTVFLDLFQLSDRMAAEEAREGPSPGRGQRILVVDDTQFFRELVRGYLESLGYQVATANNGALALREISEQPFDLVVSDIEMPEMDGWQLARAVREELRLIDLPMLALTTLGSDADKRKALACGFNGYEVKLDRESFLASVRGLLPAAKQAGGAHG